MDEILRIIKIEMYCIHTTTYKIMRTNKELFRFLQSSMNDLEIRSWLSEKDQETSLLIIFEKFEYFQKKNDV